MHAQTLPLQSNTCPICHPVKEYVRKTRIKQQLEQQQQQQHPLPPPQMLHPMHQGTY